MTDNEQAILCRWIQAGNGIHENDAMTVYEGSRPMDFLDVYRDEGEIRSAPNSMSYEEGSKYLLEEYGIDRDGVMTPKQQIYDALSKKVNRLYRTCMLYWEFLVANGLRKLSV